MLFRLPSNIGSNRATLYLGVATFFLSLVLPAPYAESSFKAFLPGGDGSYWFAI